MRIVAIAGELAKYERRNQKPISEARFPRRLAVQMLWAVGLLVISLFVGMSGYAAFGGMSWIDAFANASMPLGGMGEVYPPRTPAGKIFSGLFALCAGLVFIVTAALLFTPVLHRLFHVFHWEASAARAGGQGLWGTTARRDAPSVARRRRSMRPGGRVQKR